MTAASDDAVLLRPLFEARDSDDDGPRTLRPYLVEDEPQVRSLLGRERRGAESWPELFLAIDRTDDDLRVEARLYLPPGSPTTLRPEVRFDLGVDSATLALEPAVDEPGRPAPVWRGVLEAPAQRFLPARVRLSIGEAE